MFWALEPGTIEAAARQSGSALLTLGFAQIDGWPALLLSFGEAAIGLILVALLIAYLPTMYTAFQRREAFVAKVGVRAGTPPSGTELLIRFWSVGLLNLLTDLWVEAEAWFIDIEESHTTLAALPFYRSPRSNRSWITAAGALLDGASLLRSVVDVPAEAQSDLAITAGYSTLDAIAGFFRIPTIARPAARRRPNQGDPGRVRRSGRRARGSGPAAASGPRPGLARLRRLAGQLRGRPPAPVGDRRAPPKRAGTRWPGVAARSSGR